MSEDRLVLATAIAMHAILLLAWFIFLMRGG